MAYDDRQVQLLRDDLAGLALIEKKMFGGLSLMHRGHMLCGIFGGGGMFRVGPRQEAAAVALQGVWPMMMRDRPMPGFVQTGVEGLEDPATRRELLRMAMAFNLSKAEK